jgi:hypothetical protein
MRSFAATILAIALASSAPVLAADLPSPAPPPPPLPAANAWHFEATVDGWAPSVSASVGVLRFPTTSVQANVFQLLQHLEGIVPLSFVAYNDNFILGADLFWVRAGLSSTFGGLPGPGNFGGVNASVTLSQTIATGYGGVRLPIASPALSVFGILGARFFDVSNSVTLQTPVIGFSRSASQSKDWADPIIGIYARYRIDDKWFVNLQADGGGYSGSATWQVYPSVGYRWNPSFTTTLGYRALYIYEQSAASIGNGSFRFHETLYGPEVNLTLNF